MDNNLSNANQEAEKAIPEIVNEDQKVVISEESKKKHKRNNFFWPVILVLAGVYLLLQNLDVFTVHLNWWAVFIFIPVVASLTTAVSEFTKEYRFSAAVRGALGSAIVVGTVATMFLFDMDWGKWWPLMLIAPGLSMVLGGISAADAKKHRSWADWQGLNIWFGLAVIALGVGFLGKFLPIPAIKSLIEGYRWWAFPILFAGIGAFISAFLVCARTSFKTGWTVWSFTSIGVAVTAVGLFALYNLNWNLLTPIILIAVGLVVLAGIFIKK